MKKEEIKQRIEKLNDSQLIRLKLGGISFQNNTLPYLIMALVSCLFSYLFFDLNFYVHSFYSFTVYCVCIYVIIKAIRDYEKQLREFLINCEKKT